MIRIKQHRQLNGLIKSCTISQVPSGKYYISILVDTENIQLPKTNKKLVWTLALKNLQYVLMDIDNLTQNILESLRKD